MRRPSIFQSRFRQTLQLYFWVLFPMWFMFIINRIVLKGWWHALGIAPREISIPSFIGIFTNWTMHDNPEHIIGNSIALLQTLFLFGAFESNAKDTLFKLIIASGTFTWLFGTSGTLHIGASGLAFAMFGFILGAALFAGRWGYLLLTLCLGTSYWFSMISGLIPQEGVSFSGHFGGLLTGFVIGAFSEKGTMTSRYSSRW